MKKIEAGWQHRTSLIDTLRRLAQGDKTTLENVILDPTDTTSWEGSRANLHETLEALYYKNIQQCICYGILAWQMRACLAFCILNRCDMIPNNLIEENYDMHITTEKPSNRNTPSPHANTLEGHRTMGIRLSLVDHALLHQVAHRRAMRDGGRSNMSALIAELIEAHRQELETELLADK